MILYLYFLQVKIRFFGKSRYKSGRTKGENELNNEFTRFRLSDSIINALQVLKYTEPTPIQQEVIPQALLYKDIIAKSQTGSGKTAAFAIPLCQMADWNDNLPGALVLEPTRELTVQVKQEIFHIGRNKRLKVPDLFGGFPIDKQIQTLKQKSHIAVGTPGRVMDHIRRGTLDLSNIKYLVIDEADLMLDMGFIDEVEQIIQAIKTEFNIMLFSATLGDGLNELIEKYMQEPVSVILEEDGTTIDTITQKLYEVPDEEKYDTFLDIMIDENPDSAMIFCGTREMVNVLCRMLGRDGVRCGMIHGEIDQQDRLKTIEGFRLGKFRYLIATDVAARGIDFDNLTHVFNYDFPTGRETYIHRIGRTGRKGNTGVAVSLVCEYDRKMRLMVEEFINQQIPVYQLSEPATEKKEAFFDRQKERTQLKERKGAGFNRTITRLSISGGKKSKMRAVDIVGTLCSIEGITSEDIGIIDVRDSLTYVDVLNNKGKKVLDSLQDKTIKGKIRKVRITRGDV